MTASFSPERVLPLLPLRDVVVFSLFRDEYPQTPSAAAVHHVMHESGYGHGV